MQNDNEDLNETLMGKVTREGRYLG